jgi:hypothetical protein
VSAGRPFSVLPGGLEDVDSPAARALARALTHELGWQQVAVSQLWGDEWEGLFRAVSASGSSLLARRHRAFTYRTARCLAAFGHPALAVAVWDSPSRRTILYEDRGGVPMTERLPDASAARRLELARGYAAALAGVGEALAGLGPPPPVLPVASLEALLGFSSPGGHVWKGSFRAALDSVADGLGAGAPESEVRTRARADDVAARALLVRAPRVWSLGMEDPSQVMVVGDGTTYVVPGQLTAACAGADLLPLCAAFRLCPDEAWELVSRCPGADRQTWLVGGAYVCLRTACIALGAARRRRRAGPGLPAVGLHLHLALQCLEAAGFGPGLRAWVAGLCERAERPS